MGPFIQLFMSFRRHWKRVRSGQSVYLRLTDSSGVNLLTNLLTISITRETRRVLLVIKYAPCSISLYLIQDTESSHRIQRTILIGTLPKSENTLPIGMSASNPVMKRVVKDGPRHSSVVMITSFGVNRLKNTTITTSLRALVLRVRVALYFCVESQRHETRTIATPIQSFAQTCAGSQSETQI